MSHGEDLFPPRDETTSRPSFELALRGYDKRQVDHYVSQVDGELSTLVAERARAFDRIQYLTTQLEQVHAELTELRQQPAQLDKASFRDLGPTVDQILALAEKQAKEITDLAAHRAAEQQNEAEQVLNEAWQRANRLRADGEAAYENAEQEAKRISEQSTQQLEEARAEADRLVEAARAQAREEVEAARAQTQQEVQAREQALAQLQGELDTAEQHLDRARQEGAAAEREVAQLEQRLTDLNQELAAERDRLDEARREAESTERHSQQVRARVQREAERVAQLAAAAVMAAAARGAETGEYPMVAPPGGGNGATGQLDSASATPSEAGAYPADHHSTDHRPADHHSPDHHSPDHHSADRYPADHEVGDQRSAGPVATAAPAFAPPGPGRPSPSPSPSPAPVPPAGRAEEAVGSFGGDLPPGPRAGNGGQPRPDSDNDGPTQQGLPGGLFGN